MAKIAKADILKRNNINVLYKRITDKGAFKIGTDSSKAFQATGRIKINNEVIKSPSEKTISAFFNNNTSRDKFMVELKVKGFVNITQLFKDSEFGGVGGKSSSTGSERQELGLIQQINDNLLSNPKLKIKGVSEKIVEAHKNEGLSSLKQEPYIDVCLMTPAGKCVGVSCKGTSAPSLAGGGLAGMEVIAPEFLDKVFGLIIKELKSQGFSDGDIIHNDNLPDYYIKIPSKYIKLLLKGNEKMGGPIDYMYVGPMDVKSDIKNNQLVFNNGQGNFYTIESYMQKVGQLYIRVRKRDLAPTKMVQINFSKNPKTKREKIFTAPKTGKNNLRLVIIDKVPSTGKVLG